MPQIRADAAEKSQGGFRANASGIAVVDERERKGKTRALRLGILVSRCTGSRRSRFTTPRFTTHRFTTHRFTTHRFTSLTVLVSPFLPDSRKS
jgi:hypothetical protein